MGSSKKLYEDVDFWTSDDSRADDSDIVEEDEDVFYARKGDEADEDDDDEEGDPRDHHHHESRKADSVCVDVVCVETKRCDDIEKDGRIENPFFLQDVLTASLMMKNSTDHHHNNDDDGIINSFNEKILINMEDNDNELLKFFKPSERLDAQLSYFDKDDDDKDEKTLLMISKVEETETDLLTLDPVAWPSAPPLPPIPAPVIKPPESSNANDSGKVIRKHWHVRDMTDVSDFHVRIPNPVIKYKFELDEFQKRAIIRVNNNQHVFVSAHTSAGKTVVAEYAIALAIKEGLRAIYTSPIKALSNQKFREFQKKFASVGIITGDVTRNPAAACLIVTTEILRELLYKGSPVINQLRCVILDEIHYINDTARGVVWEETLILLPRSIQLIMLSATVPNYDEFADWVGRTKQREVFTVATSKRPTPLVHYLYIMKKAFILKDKETYNSSAFNAVNSYKKRQGSSKVSAQKSKAKPGLTHARPRESQKPQQQSSSFKAECQRMQELIKDLHENQGLPVVVFVFNRKKCEQFPRGMPKLNLIANSDARSGVHIFIKESLKGLSETDRDLPQIRMVSDLLSRGIGVHHGGLLPVVKEMVEMLFSGGLVKVLFATETFAIGINMPARSVVFSSLHKHDGVKNRALLASEYTQMSGRAGRRGLDTSGNVYIFCGNDELPDHEDVSNMMVTKTAMLESKFRVSYQMILQLLRGDATHGGITLEAMMASSFRENERAKQRPIFKRDLYRLKKELKETEAVKCPYNTLEIEDYTRSEDTVRNLGSSMMERLWHASPNSVGAILCTGRVAEFQCGSDARRWGVILSPDERMDKYKKPLFSCLLLNSDNLHKAIHTGSLHHPPSSSFSIFQKLPLTTIVLIYDCILPVQNYKISIPLDCAEENQKAAFAALASHFLSKVQDERPAILRLEKSSKQIETTFHDLILQQRDAMGRIESSPCHNCAYQPEHSKSARHKIELETEISKIRALLKDNSLEFYQEMLARQAVLKARGYLDENDCITMKGRFAAEIMTSDELTLAELFFQGVIKDLRVPEIVSLLSAFVHPVNSTEEVPTTTAGFMEARDQTEAIHNSIWDLQKALHVKGIERDDHQRICNFGLSYVAFQWASGMTFSQVVESTPIQEGSIVRAIVHLDELLRKIKHASGIIGDKDLELKMEEASEAIRRDIIFSVSLYL